MFLSLLQFFATKFLFLALHLEAGSFPRPLSPQEEIRTFAALRTGDSSAREKLIRHNLRLVAHIAKKYYALPSEQDADVGLQGHVVQAADARHAFRRFDDQGCVHNSGQLNSDWYFPIGIYRYDIQYHFFCYKFYK